MSWRWLAALLFVSAAFDWPTWIVDRAGTAALAFAFLALGMGASRGRGAPIMAPPTRVSVRDMAREAQVYAERLAHEQEDDDFEDAPARSRDGAGRTFGSEGWVPQSSEN